VPLPEPFDRLPAGAISPVAADKGEALFRNGGKSRGCFFLVSGQVRLLRWSSDGRETVIHVAKPGETFAEAALFSTSYHCDALAAADAEGYLIRKSAVEALCRTDPVFASALMARFARQIQSLRRRMEILSIPSAEERVLAALSQFEDEATGRLVNLPPLKTLAGEIGLSHEAVYRAVAKLVSGKRLVKLGRGRIDLPARL
jgi:CRP-like cAMP-binding protein